MNTEFTDQDNSQENTSNTEESSQNTKEGDFVPYYSWMQVISQPRL